MNKFDEYISRLKGEGLTRGERAHIEAGLRLFIEANPAPVRNISPFRHILRQRSFANLSFILRAMAIILILVLLAGGGASYAAEQSLPGDVLYPVKIEVNERVLAAVALSADAKASTEAGLAERRLKEAEQLAAEAKLNADVRANLESNFEAHSNEVEKNVKELDDNDKSEAAAEASSNFESILRAHADILAQINSSTTVGEIQALLLKVRTETDDTEKVRIHAEGRISANGSSTEAEAKGNVESATNKISEVTNYISKVKAELSGEAAVRAAADLKLASDTLVAAKAKLDAKAYGEAFVLASKAKRIAVQLESTFESESFLKLDLGIFKNASSSHEREGDGASSSEDHSASSSKDHEGGDDKSGSVEIDGRTGVQGGGGGIKVEGEGGAKIGI